MKRRDFGKRAMSQLQDEVAEILQMKRGKNYYKSGQIATKRQSHEIYKQNAKAKEALVKESAKNTQALTQENAALKAEITEAKNSFATLKSKQNATDEALAQTKAALNAEQTAHQTTKERLSRLQNALQTEQAEHAKTKESLRDSQVALKAEQTKHELTKTQLAAEVEKVRKASKNQGFPKEYFRELGALKKDGAYTAETLAEKIREITEKYAPANFSDDEKQECAADMDKFVQICWDASPEFKQAQVELGKSASDLQKARDELQALKRERDELRERAQFLEKKVREQKRKLSEEKEITDNMITLCAKNTSIAAELVQMLKFGRGYSAVQREQHETQIIQSGNFLDYTEVVDNSFGKFFTQKAVEHLIDRGLSR